MNRVGVGALVVTLWSALAVGSALAVSPVALAAPGGAGSLDPAFDGDGRVITDIGQGQSDPTTVVAQPDGKLVVGGSAVPVGADATIDFGLVRYLPDGKPDPTFGTGGMVTTDIRGGSIDSVRDLAVAPDGKILVVGSAGFDDEDTGGDYELVLARYQANGSLDPDFGDGGLVLTDLAGDATPTASIGLQPDGRITLSGTTAATATTFEFATFRYLTDGSPDPTFGTNGAVFTAPTPAGGLASDSIIQPNGKIVVVGRTGAAHALVRYLPDGALDPTFGTAGVVTTSVSGNDHPTAIVRQPDGKLLVIGTNSTETQVRYLSDGSLDPSFGTGGIISLPRLGDSGHTAVAVQPDGRIVRVGWSGPHTLATDLSVVRSLPDGSPDLSFGTDGETRVDFLGHNEQGRAVTVLPDGGIVAVGWVNKPNNLYFGVVRLIGTDSPDLSVTKEVEPSPTALGSTLTYSVSVANEGGAGAANVSLVDTLPAGLRPVAAPAGQGSCTIAGQTVTCPIGELTEWSAVLVTIIAEPQRTGTFTNTATATTSGHDPNPGNDRAAVTVTVGNANGCTVIGGPGVDVLAGTGGADVICGLGGGDIIVAGSGNDTVRPGSGDDIVLAGPGADSIVDKLGTDTVDGGAGDDTINTLDGSGGDTVHGSAGTDACQADPGDSRKSCP